ncbi:MAG: hypothetical protein JWP20_2890, partial [Roseomonas sp.]|nr:hypothetical protein [Roseomonas sp.]
MAEALHVVGGSIASLMAALAAGRHRPVELYADPARAGGGFGGLPVGGLRLNLGMRLLELDYEDGPAQRLPLGRYDPAMHDHRPFADTIRALVAGLAGDALVRVTPEMGFGRQRAPCALTTADIATLPPLLAPETRARIAAEAAALLADPAPPPWRFLPHRPAALDGVGLEAASRDNHGATLHALLLAPVAGRLDPGWANCPAGHRRKLWAALFHPLTVLEAFRDGRTGFRPHRPFWTLRDEGMAGLVGRIMAALKAMPLVRLHPVGRLERLSRRGAELVLDFGGPGARPARRARLPAAATVIGLGAEEAFAAAGIAYAPARLSAGFAWMRVAERDLLHGPAALLLCGAG